MRNDRAAARGPWAEGDRRRRTCLRWLTWRPWLWLAALGGGLFAGCAATAPAPMLDDDLAAFTAGIEAVIDEGMSIREARRALLERMPPPSINTEVPSPVPTANRTRRFMLAWPTLNPGTTLVLTLFCDGDGRIVRWTTGPLTEGG